MEENVYMKNMNIGESDFNNDKEIERQEEPKPKAKKKQNIATKSKVKTMRIIHKT
mgnify:CR=1 FL=1